LTNTLAIAVLHALERIPSLRECDPEKVVRFPCNSEYDFKLLVDMCDYRLEEEKKELLQKKATLLKDMGMTEEMILPLYACKKCNDTGFMKNGKGCDCYPQCKKE
jgi:hypothetical protein